MTIVIGAVSSRFGRDSRFSTTPNMVFSLFLSENFQFSLKKREKTNIVGRRMSPQDL
jgi:hypothetical protein